jgi:uroporphyrinogen decarboxylase
MSPRERVLAAIDHHEPDRVPIDIGGGSSTSISIEAYEELKRHLGVAGTTNTLSKIFRVAALDEHVMRRLGSDCRPLRSKSPLHWTPPPSAPGSLVDLWGVTWKQQPFGARGYYWEIARNPLADAGIADLDRYPWPDPLDPGFTSGLRAEAESLFRNTGYAIEASSGFYSFWELACNLRGFSRLLMDLVESPTFVDALMAKLLEINILGTERFLREAGPYIQIYGAADDLATQRGLLMSLGIYRTRLRPYYRTYFDFVRSHTGARILYHSCGNITNLIDELADIGVDAINPVQVSAMPDTAVLKSRFGSRVTFWGGIDTQHILPHGSVNDVTAEVRKRICDLAPGGGFILSAVHCIQADVPPENILAMADAAGRYGVYPICEEPTVPDAASCQ